MGTMAQEYNLSEVCHWMDQGTFYTMVLEKTYFMQLQIVKETLGWNVHSYLIQCCIKYSNIIIKTRRKIKERLRLSGAQLFTLKNKNAIT